MWTFHYHSTLDGLKIFVVMQEGENYSPDRCWLIVGTGAAERLTKLLNNEV